MARTRDALLGRDAEMDLLRGELAGALDSDSRFVMVSGEAGIGKTRLLDELVAVADGSGFLNLQGRGAEFDRERPFGPYADALDAYLSSLDAPALESLATDRLGVLAAVFPSLHLIDTAIEYPATVNERFRAHRAVRDLLERLATRHPLLLVLDDLHWADGASLELTSYLVRNPPQGEIMVAMAMRTGQGSDVLPAVLGGLQGLQHLTRIQLAPLEVNDVRQLVAEVGESDIDELLRLSGGNPFYALQLARTGVGDVTVEGRGLAVPASVASAISVELAALPEGARRIAEAAAVAGDPFDIDLAVAASDRPEEDVLQQLDVLLTRDLVRETDVPRRFQFRHPIVHRAVYGACLPSVKVACHRRVVSALAERGAPTIAMAGHVEQSARHGDLAAVEILRDAADEAAARAPTSSVRWLDAALRILPADAPIAQRVGLLASKASSEGALGRFVDAHATLEDCVLLGEGGEGETTVDLIVRCAEMEQLLGRHADSRARLEKAYHELDDPGSPAGVSLLVALTTASLYLSDHARMLEWGHLAVAAAEGLGDDALLAAALAAYTMGAAFAGEEGLALDQHDRCANLVDGLSDPMVTTRLDSLSNLTTAELYLDRHVLGSDHGERALELARATGQTHLLPTLTPILGMSLAMSGQMDKSAEVLDDAIEAARLVGDAQGLAMNLFNRALSASMSGDLDTAMVTGTESLELARSVDNGVITAFAGAIHAQTLLEMGEGEAARELLLQSVGGEEVPLLAGSWRAHFLELLTRCDLAVGDREGAVEAAERLRRQSQDHGLGLTSLMADRADAEVALAEGRQADAVEFASAAVTAARGIDASAHLPPSETLLGRALAAAGDREGAIAVLEEAAVGFDELGAVRYRDAVEAELRGLGVTVHRRSAPGQGGSVGLESLTGREMEVAELVLDRRTNREIAEELFLSTKTVETHIRNIFNKLGVSSRVEVARTLARARQPQ